MSRSKISYLIAASVLLGGVGFTGLLFSETFPSFEMVGRFLFALGAMAFVVLLGTRIEMDRRTRRESANERHDDDVAGKR